ncbi:6231_t:CDS:1, partial [Racocetra persica]
MLLGYNLKWRKQQIELTKRTEQLEKKNGKELKRIEEVEKKNERLQEKVEQLEKKLNSN